MTSVPLIYHHRCSQTDPEPKMERSQPRECLQRHYQPCLSLSSPLGFPQPYSGHRIPCQKQSPPALVMLQWNQSPEPCPSTVSAKSGPPGGL